MSSERFLVLCLESMNMYWEYTNKATFQAYDTCLIDPDLSHMDGIPFKYWKSNQDMTDVAEMTQAEKDAVDAQELEDAKQDRYSRIDTVTSYFVEQPFTFDGNQFSMSQEAQLNWTELVVAADHGGIITWPTDISTAEGGSYTLIETNLTGFMGALALHKNTELAIGRGHRDTIAAMTTLTQVEEWQDPRLAQFH